MINDKSKASVVTRLRCGKKSLKMPYFHKFIAEYDSEKLLKSVIIWQNCRQESSAKAVSCDVDYADADNRSFCGLCCMDNLKITVLSVY